MAKAAPLGRLSNGELSLLVERTSHLAPRRGTSTQQVVTPWPGTYVLRQRTPSSFEASLCEPMLCLVLQGQKEMVFADHSYRIRAGQCAVVSHDLPIVARVQKAPYLVVLIHLQLEVLRGIYEDVGELNIKGDAQALEKHRAGPQLLDAVGRYLALKESNGEARVLRPALLREIHYRLLVSPLGTMLRELLQHHSHASAIARAISVLRSDFRATLVMEKLARSVGMSVSSFHKHFKAVTASSPLQYQKDLRLLEARRLLVSGATSVTEAALEVGYESASQFSREYARKFGQPPSRDAARLRAPAKRSAQRRAL